MKKMILFSLLIFLLCFGVGYFYEKRDLAQQAEEMKQEEGQLVTSVKTIGPETEMVYEYFYKQDAVVKEQKEPAQDYLQGLTLQELTDLFVGWQVVYFSPEQVVLRCEIDGKSTEHYLLGERDGFVAVFYEDRDMNIRLKEQTDIPLAALPETEVQQLKEGLKIEGEENLAKILADLVG